MDYYKLSENLSTKKVVIWGCGYWGFTICRLMEIINADFTMVDANPQITVINSPTYEKVYVVERPDYIGTLDKDKMFLIIAMKEPDSAVYEYISQLGLDLGSYVLGTDKEVLTGLHALPSDTLMKNDPNGTLKTIEIETLNWCNNDCPFCPANYTNDPRIKTRMTDELLESILKQLGDMKYDGFLAFFSNNEPLIDTEIVRKITMARALVPSAYLKIATNGILLTLDLFLSLISVLDEMVIDNYNDALELLPNIQIVSDYCKEHPEISSKVRIYRRLKNEVLTTRAGQAPNRVEYTAPRYGCILPFSSLIIRPDGKVSLCCSDPMGKYTLGDLNKETIMDVWNGEGYRQIRSKLMNEGRPSLELCRNCDLNNIHLMDMYITKYIQDMRNSNIYEPSFDFHYGGGK